MGLSIGHLLIVLLVVLLVFGAKRLRTLGGDLGAGIKGFRDAMGEQTPRAEPPRQVEHTESNKGVPSEIMDKTSNTKP